MIDLEDLARQSFVRALLADLEAAYDRFYCRYRSARACGPRGPELAHRLYVSILKDLERRRATAAAELDDLRRASR